MNPMLIVGVIVAVLIIGAVIVMGMGASNTSDTTQNNSMKAEDSMPVADESMMAEDSMAMEETTSMMAENSFQVEGGSFYFEPNIIRVKAGEPVTITLNSVDMMHDFVIDELDVRTSVLQAGSSETITFTPTEPGEYEFYCSVGSHRAQGMVGTLIVE